LRLPTSPYWRPEQLSSSTTPPPPGVSPPPPSPRNQSRSCTPPPPGTSPVHWGTPSASSVSPLSNGEVFGSSSPPPIAADLPTYNNWSMNSSENYAPLLRKPVSPQVSIPSGTFQVEERASALPGVPMFLAHDLGLARENDFSATQDSISLSSLEETVWLRKSRPISDSLHSRPNHQKKTCTRSSRKSLGTSANLKDIQKGRSFSLGDVPQSLSVEVPRERDPRMRHTAVRETRKVRNIGELKETQNNSKEVQSNSKSEQSSIKTTQSTSKATRSRLNAMSQLPEEIDRAIKSLLYDDQESETLENTSDHLSGEVYPMFYSKEKILPCPKDIVEENISDNQSEDNSEKGAEDHHESSCEEKLEKDPESRIKDMLAEVEELSKMMEREKKKMRRLHQENETLDRELELIKEKLK